MNLTRQNLTSLGAISLHLVISSALLFQLNQQLSTTPVIENATTAAEIPTLEMPASVDRIALTDEEKLTITDNPLFNISRRPVKSLAEKAPMPSVTTDLEWRLSGIVNSSSVAVAIFITDEESRSVRLGMELEGWTLTRIGADSVTLEQAEQQVDLLLRPPTEEG